MLLTKKKHRKQKRNQNPCVVIFFSLPRFGLVFFLPTVAICSGAWQSAFTKKKGKPTNFTVESLYGSNDYVVDHKVCRSMMEQHAIQNISMSIVSFRFQRQKKTTEQNLSI